MIGKTFLRHALALSTTTASTTMNFARASSLHSAAAASSLSPNLFNESLYSSLRDFWFRDLPPNASAAPIAVTKRWFGAGVSAQEKAELDEQCALLAGDALRSIAPEKFPLPPFKSHEDDIASAATIAAPFLQEITSTASVIPESSTQQTSPSSSSPSADTLLSLILLLDQMPRNIYRDIPGLRLVYTHYDRLAFTLLHAAMNTSSASPVPEVLQPYLLRPAVQQFLLLPLMHAEYLPAHDLHAKLNAASRAALVTAGDEEAVQYIDRNQVWSRDHLEPLKKFGRYPHRNECLGRETTSEEKAFLESGAQTFGVGQGKKEEKKEEGKDEL